MNGVRAAALATTLLLAGVAVPAEATGDDTGLTAADGRPLDVGSVVAQGQRAGDICEYAPDAGTVTMTRAGGMTLRADDACRLVVVTIGDAAADERPMPGSTARPMTNADETGGLSPAGGPGGHLGAAPDDAGEAAGAAGHVAGAAVGMAGRTETVTIHLKQTMADRLGNIQYQSHLPMTFLRDTETGQMTTPEKVFFEGYCLATVIVDLGWTSPPAEMDRCYYRVPAKGPDLVGFYVLGDYRQGLKFAYPFPPPYNIPPPPVFYDFRTMTAEYELASNGTKWLACAAGDKLPVQWTHTCVAERVY